MKNILKHHRLWIYFICAAGFLVLGLLLDREFLIKSGIMRDSLTHANELVRKTTSLEVTFFRYLAFAIGIIGIVSVPLRHRILKSTLFQYLQRSPACKIPFSSYDGIIKSRELITFLVVVTVLAPVFIFGANFLSRKTMWMIFAEDGIVEYLTAILFLIACFYSFKSAVSHNGSLRKVVSILLTFGFLLCFLEEISWGQRLLKFSTPENLQALNVQKEMNLHNLLGYFADHVFISGVFIFGFMMPLVASFAPLLRKFCYAFGLPLASGGLALGFFIATLFQKWIFSEYDYGVRIAEIRELLSSLGFVFLMRQHYKYGNSSE